MFVGVEVVGGFEVEAETFAWTALVVVEEEHICAYREGEGHLAEHFEAGLGAAGFVAAQLGGVHADAFGEHGLGEASLFAEGGESVCEVHVLDGDDGCVQPYGPPFAILDPERTSQLHL